MNIEKIKQSINGNIGWEILFYPVIDSTNTVGFNKAPFSKEGLVILAESQSKGKGRLGRTWVSPPGVNIYMSIILKPPIELQDATLITLMAAVSCAIALRKISGLEITIKWPNDLMINGRKIGGILTELKSELKKIVFAVVGIGINVNAELNDFPEDVKHLATSLKNETKRGFSRTEVIIELLNEINKWYAELINNRKIIINKWKELSSTIGKKVKIATAQETIEGIAEDIDEKGMLILRLQTGEQKKIISGDLIVL